MSTLPPDSPAGPATVASAGRSRDQDLARRWATLHEAAGIVAALAGMPPSGEDLTTYPAALRQSRGWRRTLAEQGIEDLSLILQTGIAALLSARGKGAASVAPARALWDEFVAAREALVGLVPGELLNRRPL